MSRILIPNSTQIPDVILDEWMPGLSGAELAVVLFVARKTFGWGKGFDRISLTQMQEGTGLARSTVARTCDELTSKGLLDTRPAQGRTPAAYRLNMDWGPEQSTENRHPETPQSTENATSTNSGTVPKIGSTVPKNDTVTVPKIGPTRDTARDTRQETEKTPPYPQGGERECVRSQGFDTFWEAYPKKQAKEPARKAWKALAPNPALQAEISAAVQRANESDQWQRGIVPNPATWLNAKRWTDELPPGDLSARAPPGQSALGAASAEREARFASLRNNATPAARKELSDE